MSKWADYSFARPTPAQLRANGVVGVLRYLAPDDPNTHGKLLLPAERDLLLNGGLDIALNFEWYEGRCNEGAMAGTADGATALAEAKALRYPQGKCIYFSHDTGVYNWQAIDAYFRSARDGLQGYYKIGAYGSYELIQHLHDAGLIDKGWQTLAWSFGQKDPWAVIYQNGSQFLNGQVDVDDVSSTDIGSWLDGPTPEDDMFSDLDRSMLTQVFNQLPKLPLDLLTDQQTRDLLNGVNAVVGDIDKRVADLENQVAQIVAGIPGDPASFAKAVADEIAKRMES